MSVPPPHQRILPNVEINEQGLRELEIWLTDLFKSLIQSPSGWQFNFDNEGGYGYVQTNDCFDMDDFPNPLSVAGGPNSWGFSFQDASGCGFIIGSTDLLQLMGTPVLVHSQSEQLTLRVGLLAPVDFTLNHADGTITLPSGAVIGP